MAGAWCLITFYENGDFILPDSCKHFHGVLFQCRVVVDDTVRAVPMCTRIALRLLLGNLTTERLRFVVLKL